MKVRELIQWLATFEDQDADVKVVQHVSGSGYYDQGGNAKAVTFDPENYARYTDLRGNGVKKHTLWLGISTDEAHRIKPSGTKQVTHVYPLIDLGMSRKDCEAVITAYGWPLPSKSRCFMCPHMSRKDWLELPEREQIRAVLVDDAIREKDPDVYLHRSGKPLRDALKDDADAEPSLFDGCDSGMCWT